MTGKITHLNRATGMAAALTEEGYSIIETSGSDPIEIGDLVSWQDDTVLGDATLQNRTQGVKYSVYFQNHHVSHPTL